MSASANITTKQTPQLGPDSCLVRVLHQTSSSPSTSDASLPTPMNPVQQRRRAALLAESPEPPPHGGMTSPGSTRGTSGHSGGPGNIDQVELFIEAASVGEESGLGCCTRCCVRSCAKLDRSLSGFRTRNVWKSIMLGQLIALLLCSSAILCQILVENYNVKLPAAQNFGQYLLMILFYLSVLVLGLRRTGDSFVIILRRRGLRYFVLGIIDAQANYLTNKAFQYTTLTGVQLLDCFAIPNVLVLSWLVLKVRYRLNHIGGLALALMSVVTLVWVDVEDGKGGVSMGGQDRLIGDMLTLAAALLTGLSHVGMEHSMRYYDAFEFLGMVGLFGSLVTALQIALLEREALTQVRWELWEIGILLACFAVAQFVRISCLPFMVKLASSAGLNLSLLASDFYAIMAGVMFLHYKFHPMYVVSIALVLVGILIFNIHSLPTSTTSKSEELSVLMTSSTHSGLLAHNNSARSSQTSIYNQRSASPDPDIPLTALKELNFCATAPCSIQPTSMPTIEVGLK